MAIFCRRSPLFTHNVASASPGRAGERPAGRELTLDPPMRSPVQGRNAPSGRSSSRNDFGSRAGASTASICSVCAITSGACGAATAIGLLKLARSTDARDRRRCQIRLRQRYGHTGGQSCSCRRGSLIGVVDERISHVLVRRKVGGASVRGRAPWPQSRPPVRRVRVCAGRKPSRWPGVHDWGTTLDSAAACSACSGPFKLRRTIGDRVYSPVAARGSIGFETSRLLTRSRRVTWWARANAASTAAKRPAASFVSSCSRSAPSCA